MSQTAFYRWKIRQRAESDALFQQECIERFGPFQNAKKPAYDLVSCGISWRINAAQPLIEHYLKLDIRF